MTGTRNDQGNTEDHNADAGELSGEAVVSDAELTEEEVTAKADEDFAAGFNKATGEEEVQTETPAADAAGATADTDSDAEAKTSEEAADAADENATQFRSLNAKYGGMASALKRLDAKIDEKLAQYESMTPPAGTQVPTAEEMNAALKDPEKMTSLVERYEDFAPIQDELAHLHNRIGEQQVTPEQINAMVSQRVETSKVDDAHPGWEETMGVPEFKTYCLAGGPTTEEYDEVAGLEGAAARESDPTRQRGLYDQFHHGLNVFQTAYPTWWDAKGEDVFSSKAANTIRLFDGFKSQISAQGNADPQSEAQQRLRENIKPQTTSGRVSTGVSNEDAFSSGFDKVHGASKV
jgi:hypothetical protein